RARAKRSVKWEPTVSTPLRRRAQARSRPHGCVVVMPWRGGVITSTARRAAEALVGGGDPLEASHQVPEQLELAVVRARWQERIGDDHARAGDAQAQLEAIVVQLLGRAVAVVGPGLEAAVAPAARVAADGQRQRVDHLRLVLGLPAYPGQTLLNRCI